MKNDLLEIISNPINVIKKPKDVENVHNFFKWMSLKPSTGGRPNMKKNARYFLYNPTSKHDDDDVDDYKNFQTEEEEEEEEEKNDPSDYKNPYLDDHSGSYDDFQRGSRLIQIVRVNLDET